MIELGVHTILPPPCDWHIMILSTELLSFDNFAYFHYSHLQFLLPGTIKVHFLKRCVFNLKQSELFEVWHHTCHKEKLPFHSYLSAHFIVFHSRHHSDNHSSPPVPGKVSHKRPEIHGDSFLRSPQYPKNLSLPVIGQGHPRHWS